MSLMLSRWAALHKGTKSEHSLEPAIASLGQPYRWQHPVWSCWAFLDFAFPRQMIAVEVDGADHLKPDKAKKDAERTAKLEAKGWRVWRTTNERALKEPYQVVEDLLTSYPELELELEC